MVYPEMTDREFVVLSDTEKVAYLNQHNFGDFRELTENEKPLYTQFVSQKYGKKATYKPYAIRESTNDLVVIENTKGWYGKMSARLFVSY